MKKKKNKKIKKKNKKNHDHRTKSAQFHSKTALKEMFLLSPPSSETLLVSHGGQKASQMTPLGGQGRMRTRVKAKTEG